MNLGDWARRLYLASGGDRIEETHNTIRRHWGLADRADEIREASQQLPSAERSRIERVLEDMQEEDKNREERAQKANRRHLIWGLAGGFALGIIASALVAAAFEYWI